MQIVRHGRNFALLDADGTLIVIAVHRKGGAGVRPRLALIATALAGGAS